MPLKTKELHRFVRDELGPALIGLGFRRTPRTTMASWARPIGDRWFVIVFQPSVNDVAGWGACHFTVEFRTGARLAVDLWGYRRRLPTLLTEGEREELLGLENRVLAKQTPPGHEQMSTVPEGDRERFLRDRRHRSRPYYPGEDVWFSHWDDEDLQALMAFVSRVLPGAIERFLQEVAEDDRLAGAQEAAGSAAAQDQPAGEVG